MDRVYLIGAGPGSADLITLRGARVLGRSRVVLHDALVDEQLQVLGPQARWVDVGKRGFTDSTAQARINDLLVEEARGGGIVVRLKGGDPSIFGRLDEELEALARAGIACEVVPGVTAAIAAAADLRRPLTRRGSGRSVALVTAMTRSGALVAARGADTEVFYMAGRQLGALAGRLIQAGWTPDTPATVVSRAGWPDRLESDHLVGTLEDACVLHGGRPTVVIVGIGAAPLDGGATASSEAGPVSASALPNALAPPAPTQSVAPPKP